MSGTSDGVKGYGGTPNEKDWDTNPENNIITDPHSETNSDNNEYQKNPYYTDEELKDLGCISCYDYALKRKLLEVFPNVVMSYPENVMNTASEDSDGKVKLPLISAFRSNTQVLEKFNHHESFHGRVTRRNMGLPCSDNYQLEMAIQMTIEYQIDIWAQYREYADGILRELLFYMLRNPYLTVYIPEYDDNQLFATEFVSMDSPTDYSAIEGSGVIHRYTLTYNVPTARLFYRGISAKMVRDIPIKLVPFSNYKRIN